MIFIAIDVRELAPPEPMTAILTALSTLPDGDGLRVHHSRQPFPLYEKLTSAGWAYECKKKAENYFLISIYRHQDNPT